MTLAEKDTIILDLQCKQSAFATKLVKAVTLGICPVKFLKTNTELSLLIKTLKRYIVLDSDITNAYSISFTIDTINDMYNINLVVGSDINLSYNGTGTIGEILVYFRDLINTEAETNDYLAEIKDNILYIYSYDIDVNYSDIPTLTSDSSEITTSIISLQNNLNTLLDIQNCITFNQFCNIKKRINKLFCITC